MAKWILTVVVACGLLGLAGPVFAEDEAPPASDTPDETLAVVPPVESELPPGGCVRTIPARCVEIEKEIVIPAKTRIERIPLYESCEVPVFDLRYTPIHEEIEIPIYKWKRVPVFVTRRVPILETIEVPTFKWRRLPIFTTRRVPTYETVEIPVFSAERIPRTKEVCDPCTGETKTVVCGHDVKVAQCGTRTEQRCTGHKEERVQSGWRPERFEDGTRTQTKIVGWKEERVECTFRWERYQDGSRTVRHQVDVKTERVQTGTRTVRRCVGTTPHEVEVCPARTETQVTRVTLKCRRVTVVADGVENARPLRGTCEVLTESEYQAALGGARKP